MIYKPLQWLFRIIGIAPCNSATDKYFIVLPVLASASFWVYEHFHRMHREGMIDTILWINMAAYWVAPLVFIIYNHCNRQVYTDILRNLAAADSELGAQHDFRLQKIVFILFVAFCCIKFVVGVVMTLRWNSFVQVRMLASILVLVPQLQHTVLVILLRHQFSALNSLISDITADVDNTPQHTVSSRLDFVFRLHTHLHVVVWDVNTHFCIYNLLSVLARLFYVLLRMYEYLLILSGGISPWNPLRLSVATLNTISFIVQCLLCHAGAREANRTALLCHRLLRPDTPVQLWEQVGVFSRLSLHNKVRFSVGGIFSLDRPFIAKMSVTALSYLIITIQLKDVQPSNSNSGS
ncbi:gustatory receptor [Homalodisca vitripennis]|nr:gustatory receptor [Homalodisca vitripennis]